MSIVFVLKEVIKGHLLYAAGCAISEFRGEAAIVFVSPLRVTAAGHLNVNFFMSLNVLKVLNLIVDMARMMDGVNQGAGRDGGASIEVIAVYGGIQRLIPCLGDENFLGVTLPNILIRDAVDYTSGHAVAYGVALGAGFFGGHVGLVNFLRHDGESQRQAVISAMIPAV